MKNEQSKTLDAVCNEFLERSEKGEEITLAELIDDNVPTYANLEEVEKAVDAALVGEEAEDTDALDDEVDEDEFSDDDDFEEEFESCSLFA